MRSATTRLMVAGELIHPIGSVASKAGLNRSTVSRMFNGRMVSIATLLAVLAVLGLTFADVTSGVAMPAEATGGR